MNVPAWLASHFPELFPVDTSGSFIGTYVLPMVAWLALVLAIAPLIISTTRGGGVRRLGSSIYFAATFTIAMVGAAHADLAYVAAFFVLMAPSSKLVSWSHIPRDLDRPYPSLEHRTDLPERFDDG